MESCVSLCKTLSSIAFNQANLQFGNGLRDSFMNLSSEGFEILLLVLFLKHRLLGAERTFWRGVTA